MVVPSLIFLTTVAFHPSHTHVWTYQDTINDRLLLNILAPAKFLFSGSFMYLNLKSLLIGSHLREASVTFWIFFIFIFLLKLYGYMLMMIATTPGYWQKETSQ